MKNKFWNIFSQTKTWLKKHIASFQSAKNKKKIQYNILSLAPEANPDRYSVYTVFLSEALKNKTVRNIAITGPYGSGKSSILKTHFDKKRHFQKHIYVSLADFQGIFVKDDQGSEEINKKNNLIESSIERSILQQLYYQIGHRKVPFSRFKRITGKRGLIALGQFMVMLTVVLTLTLIIPTKLLSIYDTSVMAFSRILVNIHIITPQQLFWVLFSWFIVLGSIVLYNLICAVFINRQLSKVTTKLVDIELSPTPNNSIFNQYLDEIVYFFQRSKVNVVCFEDLDRFDSIDIFTKLRELNNLLNNSKDVNRRIVFVYAIKDDLYKNEFTNRTKFFDFVLPIIPVVNSENSADMLINNIPDASDKESLNINFLSKFSYYVYDMRSLKDILNEYYTYKYVLQEDGQTRIDKQKLFAMIVYKVVHPCDFAALHDNSGIVYNSLFQKKAVKKAAIAAEIKSKLEKIQALLMDANHEHLKNMKELNTVSLFSLISDNYMNDGLRSINIDGSHYSVSDLINGNIKFEEVLHSTSTFRYSSYSFNSTTVARDKIEQVVIDYQKRKKAIEDKTESNHTSLENKSLSLNDDLRELDNLSFRSLVQNYGQDDLIDPEADDLIRYLLLSGLINEDFASYMSYFYEGLLTRNDHTFLMHVLLNDPLPYSYPLTNKEEILNRLNVEYFSYLAIQNFDLIKHLLTNQQKYEVQLKKLFTSMSIEPVMPSTVSFIDAIYHSAESFEEFQLRDFFSRLFHYRPTLWRDVTHLADFDATINQCRHSILVCLLNYCSSENLRVLSTNSTIADEIGSLYELDSLMGSASIEQYEAVLTFLPIKLSNVGIPYQKKAVIKLILANRRYEINFPMIYFLLKNYYGIPEEDIRTKNYTCILSISESELSSYVTDNMDIYIPSVFLALNAQNEEEHAILELLRLAGLTWGGQIIDKVRVQFSDLAEIDKRFYPQILKQKKLEPVWRTILQYYLILGLDAQLVEYINSEVVQLGSFPGRNSDDAAGEADGSVSSLLNALIVNASITDEALDRILDGVALDISPNLIQTLSTSRLKYLISRKLVLFTPDTHKACLEKSPAVTALFIKDNLDSFINNQNIYVVTDNLLYELLLLELPGNHIMAILRNLPDNLEISVLTAVTIAIRYGEMLARPNMLSIQKLQAVLEPLMLGPSHVSSFTKGQAIDVLIQCSALLSDGLLSSLVTRLGHQYGEMLTSPVTIPFTEHDKDLLDLLKSRKLIKRYRHRNDELTITAN